MPLEIPVLDDRNYADILRDALARIPVHNPDWTNFNDSDPGVTMIQLFAFMAESILYRANQIPERNRLKFLKMLGIPLRPATAATGFVTIRNERGPLAVETFPRGLDVRAGQVRFLTTQGLDVLPIEAQAFYKQPQESGTTEEDAETYDLYKALYADLLEDGTQPRFYQSTPMPLPQQDGTLPIVDLANAVDGSLWIALLARKGDSLDDARAQIAEKTLTLGVMPRLTDEGIVVEPGIETRAEDRTPVNWEIATVIPNSSTPSYTPLTTRGGDSILNEPGLVEITLPAKEALTTWDFSTLEPGLEGTGDFPPSLADTSISDRVITWLRLRLKNSQDDDTVKAKLSWVGINATRVQQQVKVIGEVLGSGTGEPDQCYTLANTPVLPESVVLMVDGEPWFLIDDILSADAEVQINNPRKPIYVEEAAVNDEVALRSNRFTLDPESGEICFGDGAHGARPKAGQTITVSYEYGGGQQGNVGIGMINRSPNLPASYKVGNPLRTWGGDNAEETQTAEKTIPRTVQHRDRLVSVQDFEDVTKRTPGVDLGRVDVLPLFMPPADNIGVGTEQVPGIVTVMVIPESNTSNNPKPDQFFLQLVCDHLQPRRLITTELYVRGPQYVDVWVSVAVKALGGYAFGPVREAIREEIIRFLSPLVGGYNETGWPLKTSVTQRGLEAVVARVNGVQEVNELYLGSETDNEDSVPLYGLQLPRLAGIRITEGTAIPISQVRNAPLVAGDSGDQPWMAIPVIPEKC